MFIFDSVVYALCYFVIPMTIGTLVSIVFKYFLLNTKELKG